MRIEYQKNMKLLTGQLKLEASEAEQNYTGSFNLHFLTGIKMYPAVNLLITGYGHYHTGAPPLVICTYIRTRSGA